MSIQTQVQSTLSTAEPVAFPRGGWDLPEAVAFPRGGWDLPELVAFPRGGWDSAVVDTLHAAAQWVSSLSTLLA